MKTEEENPDNEGLDLIEIFNSENKDENSSLRRFGTK